MRSRISATIDEQTLSVQERYSGPEGIIRFVYEILGVKKMAPYQEEILRDFVIYRRIAVRGPHGLGKSAMASWITLWMMATFDTDVKIVTTASAWRQLEKYLWPEIHKWTLKAAWEKIKLNIRFGKELFNLSFKLPGKEAFAAASDHPELIEGAHASVVAYIFDESKTIPEATFDAAEGAFSQEGLEGKSAYALAISTPGEAVGRFYDIHMRKPGFQDWRVRHVTLQEAIEAGQISQIWADNRKAQWGEKSSVYQTRVEGNFAENSEDSVIPLSWVERSNEKWLEIDGKTSLIGKVAYGLDPARYGEDKTGFCKIVDNVVPWIKYYAKEDTMQIVGRVRSQVEKHHVVAVDVIGVGAGVFDRLKELGQKSRAVNVGHATTIEDESGELKFADLRSAIWWMLRDWLDPKNPYSLILPPDDRLIGDLVAPKWRTISRGSIKVESKDEIRKRLEGRSTDAADCVGLAVYAVLNRDRKGGGNLR